MSSSRTLSRKFRTFFTCIKPRFDPSIILLYIAASVEQYCDITQVNALPENEGILEPRNASSSASTQKSACKVLDKRQDKTARLCQSMITTKYRKPRGIGI